MNGHAESPPSDLLAKLQAFRRSDDDRDQMVEQLIMDFALLKNDYQDKCNDYESETHSRRKWQNQYREAESALTSMRQSSVRENDPPLAHHYVLTNRCCPRPPTLSPWLL